MKFYQMNTDILKKELNTDFQLGLTENQVEERKKECSNDNVIPFFSVEHIKANFLKPIIFVVLSACVYFISAIFLKDINYLFSAIAVLATAFIGFIPFIFAVRIINKKIDSANRSSFFKLHAVRNGKKVMLNAKEFLYGDIAYLKKGDYIPFDAYILEADNLLVDETDVCQNSVSEKSTGVISEENVSVSDIHNFVFSGSFVLNGSAKVVVTDVGKRVYTSKIKRKSERKYKCAAKTVDVFKFIFLALTLISSIATVIVSLFTKEFVFSLSSVLIIVSFFLFDYLSVFIDVLFSDEFLQLKHNGYNLKDASVLDSLNAANVILIEQDILFDEHSEISGFTNGADEYFSVSQIDKFNFAPFLYCNFASFSPLKSFNPSLFNSSVRILKKHNINYNELDSLCPSVSHYENFSSSYEICGRVYDGDNLLIAKGDYVKILEMCSLTRLDISENVLSKLFETSTEIIGVAVKNVPVIPSDLSEETDGYKLIGLIGVRKQISDVTIKKMDELENRGIHNIILYSGDKLSALQIFNENDCCAVSYNESLSLSKEKLLKCKIIYDYPEDNRDIVEKVLSFNFKPIVCGGCANKKQKVITFDSFDAAPYLQKDRDVICKPSFDSVYNVVSKAKKIYSSIDFCIENIIVFFMFYTICGVLFSVLNKKLLFSPPLLIYIILFSLYLTLILTIFFRDDSRKIHFTVSGRKLLINLALTAALFVSFIIVLKLCVPCRIAAGMLACAYTAFVPNIKKIGLNILLYIPSVLILVLLCTPLSAVFGVSGFVLYHGVISIAVGVLFRFILQKISGLIKI